ncbi:hypothetical protein GJ496_007480 [Pomphorhynchus laevis]|nr:hypothetical protein GJ496_007480 [Pomphorhynchus laevis]
MDGSPASNITEATNCDLHSSQHHIDDNQLLSRMPLDERGSFFSECQTNSSFNKPVVDVRLIDFVHVYPNENPGKADENFLYGLNSLINYLESLLQPGFVCKKLPQFSSCLKDDVTTCSVTEID